jgi:hypothetical protein
MKKAVAVIITIIFILILCACVGNNPILSKEIIIPSISPSLTNMPKLSDSQTPTPNRTETKVARNTEFAMLDKTFYAENSLPTRTATPTLPYPELCSDSYHTYESPDKKWTAINCYSWNGFRLNVWNEQGKMWVIMFNDLNDYPLPTGAPGPYVGTGFSDFFWDLKTEYLYFTIYQMYDPSNYVCKAYGNTKSLYRLTLETGNLETLLKPDLLFYMEYSPTGHFIAIDKDGVTLLDLITGESEIINPRTGVSFEWSPDGRYLAYSVVDCSQDGGHAISSSAYLYDTENGKSLTIMDFKDAPIYIEEWISDSKIQITNTLYDYAYKNTYIYDLQNGTTLWLATITPTP